MEATYAKPTRRFYAGLILLAALAIYSGLQSLRYYDIRYYSTRMARFGIFASDEISLYQRQFACLLPWLEPGEVAGFLSPLESEAQIQAHLLTQYALAPAVIALDGTPGQLVAVYPNQEELQAAIPEGFAILADCGNGVGLIARTGRP